MFFSVCDSKNIISCIMMNSQVFGGCLEKKMNMKSYILLFKAGLKLALVSLLWLVCIELMYVIFKQKKRLNITIMAKVWREVLGDTAVLGTRLGPFTNI